jgi:hypothetical protein
MNKRVLSSVFIIAITATLGIFPSAVPRAHAIPTASLMVGPNFAAGNPGDIFTFSVMVDNVANLAGFDVQLHYNGAALNAVQPVDFSGPFAGTGCTIFPIQQTASDSAGLIRSAEVTLSGCTTTISDLSTGATPIFTVTFVVVSRANSQLHITTDSECACSSLAAITNGNPIGVAHTSSDGHFFAEPNIVFQKTFNVTSVPRNARTVNGVATVTFESGVFLQHGETLAGFVFVVFDIITPGGTDISLNSQEIFLGVGASFTLSATHTFTQKGTYEMFGTLWRGSDITAVVQFESLSGQTFRVT